MMLRKWQQRVFVNRSTQELIEQVVKMKIEIYTDGGSRGNPGPAATGVVIGDPFHKTYSSYIGERTNNEAEYEAALLALQKVKSLVGKKNTKQTEVVLFMDSQLAVMQLRGKYKIMGDTISPLFLKIHNLAIDFLSVEYVHIPREKNKEADAMVNKELDKRTGRGGLF